MENAPPKRLSRPVYEGLPWFYLVCGIAACVGSYFLAAGVLSFLVGLVGLAGILGGAVILLRRRDYRDLRSQYGNPDALNTTADKDER
jgi:Flp pilus assembly protein TadB